MKKNKQSDSTKLPGKEMFDIKTMSGDKAMFGFGVYPKCPNPPKWVTEKYG